VDADGEDRVSKQFVEKNLAERFEMKATNLKEAGEVLHQVMKAFSLLLHKLPKDPKIRC
jgi:hypothetical protein